MSHSVESKGTAIEFQRWSAAAPEFPGYINKGWACLNDITKTGVGWVTFETRNQAMMFKLSNSG